jgi:hypothetical protein
MGTDNAKTGIEKPVVVVAAMIFYPHPVLRRDTPIFQMTNVPFPTSEQFMIA